MTHALDRATLSGIRTFSRQSGDGQGRNELVTIRKLTENDAEALWRLRKEALETDPVSFGESLEEHLKKTVEEFASRLRTGGPENFVVGAFDDGRLVGMSGFYRDTLLKRRHIGHVWGVFVSPGQRGKGIGRALLTEVMRSSNALDGLRCLRLMVAVPQEAARKLYERMGFRVFGTEPESLRIGDQFVDENHMTLEFEEGNLGKTREIQ